MSTSKCDEIPQTFFPSDQIGSILENFVKGKTIVRSDTLTHMKGTFVSDARAIRHHPIQIRNETNDLYKSRGF